MPRIKANFELRFLLRKTQSPLGFPQFQVLLLVQPYSKELVLGGQRRADDSGGNVRRSGFPSGPQTGAPCTAHHKLAALLWF